MPAVTAAWSRCPIPFTALTTLCRKQCRAGGGTDYFCDRAGQWWCAFFGNDTQAPWREKPGIVPIAFDPDGRIRVSKTTKSGSQ